MTTKKTEPETAPKKTPRHIAIGTRHLVIQRDKLIAIRDGADLIAIRDGAVDELKGIDAALLALGWQEQLNLL
jgi:hypothetical protein